MRPPRSREEPGRRGRRAFVEGDVPPQFGWLARFLTVDAKASSAITQQLFGWTPTHPTLLEDLEAGYYFR